MLKMKDIFKILKFSKYTLNCFFDNVILSDIVSDIKILTKG